MRIAALAALAVLAPALVHPARAATLRDLTTLSGPTVRLSDLFDKVEQDRVIGPAPEPGGRIVVEEPQLAAIARQFDVDWRPASDADRVVLERPGSMFPRQAVMDALHTALVVAGMPPGWDVAMPTYTPPMVPTDGNAHAEVAQVDFDPITGRFTSVLSIMANGMTPAHARLSGRAVAMIDLPVATRRLLPGEIVAPGDVQISRVRANLVRTEVARLPEQAVGQAVRRQPIAAGAPLPMTDLGPPVVVPKDATVTMQLDSPGLSLTAQGVAMEPGGMGDQVRVLNPVTRALVTAQVIGPGQVRVTPGTASILPVGSPMPIRIAGQ
jgi:flagella basal body P-ring formation protein FlgA